jgi:4-hydroxy-tetrahydrodipicolinate reductase
MGTNYRNGEKTMIKVIVAGASGRMGKRIIQMVHQDPEIDLAGAFEKPNHPHVGKDVGQEAGLGELGIKITGSLSEIIDNGEVLIDFTVPNATLENVRQVSARGLAMVIGTTGFPLEASKEIETLTKDIRCVMAPNMSVGVNVMFKIAQDMVRILGPDYDMEILEIHHNKKKDAPSGTALRLARILAETAGRDLERVGVYERKGMIGERTENEIGIQSLRAGDITGEHTIIFGGIGERLELTHRAHNRDNFARGALRAARWVINQPSGIYDMQDVLGLRERG